MCLGVATLGLGLAYGCSAGPGVAVGDSGATDSSSGDAGALDAVAVDAPARDAAAFPAPAWQPIAELPSGCDLYRAANPSSVLPPLAWEACGAQRAGCRHLARATKPPYVAPVSELAILHLAGRATLFYGRLSKDARGAPSAPLTYVAENPDGEVTFALGRPAEGGGCAVTMEMAESGQGLSAYVHRDAGAYYLAEFRSPSFAQSPLKTFPKTSWGVNPAEGADLRGYSNSAFYMFMNIPVGLAFVNFATGQDGVVGSATEKRPGLVPSVSVRDGSVGIEFNGGGDLGALVWLDAKGGFSRITTVTFARVVRGVAVDHGHDDDLVWLELQEGSEASGLELFTSPFTKDAAGLKKRKVATDKPGGRVALAAHKGIAAFVNGEDSARVVRLADGLGWTIKADLGRTFTYVAGLTDDEVWIFSADEFRGLPDDILRIRLDSLGAPSAGP
jgi:hypothetical protein